VRQRQPRPLLYLALLAALGISAEPARAQSGAATDAPDCRPLTGNRSEVDLPCPAVEQVTIFGSAADVQDVAGGATYLAPEDLERFEASDVVRGLRQVPGLSFQVEDGYGLRPNLSIRGTATERSSRITLMEDGVLIAPAPYTAPSAYYFPTFGRIHAVEVLKGPSAITQGPYTVGGAVNLISTPIPDDNAGMVQGEFGSFDTWRLHGWYGGGNDRVGFLVETHQWRSDGYQHIDRSDADTGLDKEDYLAKFRIANDPGAEVRHTLDLRVSTAEEQSEQSYLGLTDRDFAGDELRRYGLSERDVMDNEHRQLTATWRMAFANGAELAVTGYDNDFERAWYKTEGIDFDGSDNAQAFSRTSWARVIQAINRGESLGGLAPDQLQAILDGADTAPGAIQLRNNSREYFSRGLQVTGSQAFETDATRHTLQLGLRYHEDEEDRLQRNDSYQQLDGRLVLSDRGLEGNAGNRIQDAEAWAAFVHDRIEWQAWTFTPGVRFESIELRRTDFGDGDGDPSRRDPDNVTRVRRNDVDVWIPGVGVLYDLNETTRLVAGVHKGFAVPGNQPGVDEEESVNYELGVRYGSDRLSLDVIGFFNDYENLVGVCTNASGSDCEPGDAFNGDGVHIPGLEVAVAAELGATDTWTFPLNLTWTWMDAEFQTDFASDFFGEVRAGDPVPYVPEHQGLLTLGAVSDRLSFWLSANYVDSVCTQARCGAFERTESATLLDLAVHWRLDEAWSLYANAENVTDDLYIAGREPYGARPNKPRAFNAGVRFDF